MNAKRFTFDTNILFYASDRSGGEKHRKALRLTEEAIAHDCILTLQALGELASAFIKKGAASAERTRQIIRGYRESFPVVPGTEADLDEALLLHQQHSISFWDAMLWATARRNGCTLILTEDLQDGRVLGGVTLCNPFKLSASALDSLFL